MVKAIKGTGLSPEQVERIKAAQKRHSAHDPGCETLSPEEFIRWHPVNGMSWEERARRMREAGIVDTDTADPYPTGLPDKGDRMPAWGVLQKNRPAL